MGVPIEQVAPDPLSGAFVPDEFRIVPSCCEKYLEGGKPLLPINDLERRDTAGGKASTRFQHHRSHVVRKSTLPTRKSFHRLGTDIVPERLPLLLTPPNVMPLIDRNAVAVLILQQLSDFDWTGLHTAPSQTFAPRMTVLRPAS